MFAELTYISLNCEVLDPISYISVTLGNKPAPTSGNPVLLFNQLMYS